MLRLVKKAGAKILPAIDSMGLEMKVAAILFIVIKIIDYKVQ